LAAKEIPFCCSDTFLAKSTCSCKIKIQIPCIPCKHTIIYITSVRQS
jgi:hypothetical protein